MIERSDKLPNEILENNEACCNDTTCSPSKTPIIRDTPKIGRNDPCISVTGVNLKDVVGKIRIQIRNYFGIGFS